MTSNKVLFPLRYYPEVSFLKTWCDLDRFWRLWLFFSDRTIQLFWSVGHLKYTHFHPSYSSSRGCGESGGVKNSTAGKSRSSSIWIHLLSSFQKIFMKYSSNGNKTLLSLFFKPSSSHIILRPTMDEKTPLFWILHIFRKTTKKMSTRLDKRLPKTVL